MIFLDTNVLIRYFVEPVTGRDHVRFGQARALFLSIESGAIRATTSEVVIHEVCFVLGSKYQYGLPPSEIIERIRSVLQFSGMSFPGGDRAIYLRALALWEQHPKLEFSDSVIAARCERSGHELATFDGHFAAITSLTRWQPDSLPRTPT